MSKIEWEKTNGRYNNKKSSMKIFRNKIDSLNGNKYTSGKLFLIYFKERGWIFRATKRIKSYFRTKLQQASNQCDLLVLTNTLAKISFAVRVYTSRAVLEALQIGNVDHKWHKSNKTWYCLVLLIDIFSYQVIN